MNWQGAIIPVLEYLKSDDAIDVSEDDAAHVISALLPISESSFVIDI